MEKAKIDIAVLVVNSIAAVFAVIAAIIAVVVYIKTARLQRNAINYSLLDERIKMWKYMEHDRHKIESIIAQYSEGREWKVEKFKLLFSDKLVHEYEKIMDHGKILDTVYGKMLFLEDEGLPVRKTGEKVNQEDFGRYCRVKKEREKLFEADAGIQERAEFEALCQECVSAEKWQEYYQSVTTTLQKKREQELMWETFFKHMHDEIEASIAERKQK